MSSSCTPTPPTLARLLEVSTLLHSADSATEYFAQLEQLLPELIGTQRFTWVALASGEGVVLHSSEIPGLVDRLHPPRLNADAIAKLQGSGVEAPLDRGASLSLQVEGHSLEVSEIWRISREEVDGGALLLLHRAKSNQEPYVDQQLLESLLSVFSGSWRRLRHFSTLKENLDHSEAKLGAIGEIGKHLGSLEVDVLLSKLMELSLYVVRGQVGSIVLFDEKEQIECPVEWGLPLATARCFQDQAGQSVLERVLQTGQAFRFGAGDTSEDLIVTGADVLVDSFLCIPLNSQKRTIGAINIVNSMEEDGFSRLDLEVLMAINGLAATSIENAMLHHDSIEKERLRQSMEIARDIQQKLYPSEPPELEENLEIAWRSEPCDETGGDYFDFVNTPDGIAIIVGDVSGHGVGAALLMASARAGLRSALARGVPVAEAVQALNDQLDRDTDADQFMTLLVLAWSPGSQWIEYVNAGHDSPCIYRAESGELESLSATGIPLGLFSGMEYDSGKFAVLSPGDALLLTTDGVWEVADSQGKMLGKTVLLELFRGFAGYSADRIAVEILEAVGRYTDHAPPRDDRTLVVFRALESDCPKR